MIKVTHLKIAFLVTCIKIESSLEKIQSIYKDELQVLRKNLREKRS